MNLAIIGAGPVGIYFSKLCLDRGFNVTLIEAGNRSQESILLNRQKYVFNSASALPEGVHKIGGGSTKWRGRISEFLDQDFITKNFPEQIEWPISKKDLEKYYKELYKTLKAGEMSDQELINRFFANEIKYLPEDFYLRSFRYCETDFFIKLFHEIKHHKQFILLEDHFCQEIQNNIDGTLNIKVALTDGTIISENFGKVIIAGGTLQSTALLQRSKRILPKSSQKTIGKYLMEHIEGYVGTIIVKNGIEKKFFKNICNNGQNRCLEWLQGIGVAISLRSNDLNDLDKLNVQFEIRSFMNNDLQLNKIKSDIVKFPIVRVRLLTIFKFITKVILFLFNKLRSFVDRIKRIDRFSVYVKAEELKNINSSMEIMENAPDIIVYNHQISERTISLLQVEMERFISIFNTHFKSNVKYLNRLNDSKNFRKHFGANWHPMGTTPMGLDRLTAICDPDLQVIGVKNLFVLSASVFPSGSNSNPTFTVLALACRLANSKHFKDNYRL
jgi:hypothetical protein